MDYTFLGEFAYDYAGADPHYLHTHHHLSSSSTVPQVNLAGTNDAAHGEGSSSEKVDRQASAISLDDSPRGHVQAAPGMNLIPNCWARRRV
ncbi:hypothetical protein IAT38_004140 [Cryptococcus sp. DSM 104549]